MIELSLQKTQLLGFLRPLNPQAHHLGVFLYRGIDTPWHCVVTMAPLLGVETCKVSRQA